ncbi:hypothetical protein K466DRAFT_566290 [Polyporus arcularius HHB13444]|uniref:F-box domain-containing protein n=1 Tax=Polyporus arcularius HHB13444 TaxID=1314778 RepID=A0A5C3P8H9_9APHY|nr:hypothetical protein K466DRAFT_566290 [Polyporus arcularius HHB13444]
MSGMDTLRITAELPRTRGTPVLNLDVFRTILQSCAVADLLQVGYASSTTRKEAVRELLSRPIYLQSNRQVHSFYHLMFADDPDGSRVQYLQTLVLDQIPDVTDEVASMLLVIVRRASQLRNLYLGPYFILLDTHFADAVAQLEHLRLLKIRTVYRHLHGRILPMLRQLRSTLNTLEVPEYDYYRTLGDHFPNQVAECQPQLAKLRICYPTLTPNWTWTPYPSLRVLALRVEDQISNLQLISILFPNLRELSMSAHLFAVDLSNPIIMTTRNASIAFQEDGGGWKSLDHLSGSIWDLYTLCSDVISRTRPRRLDMEICCTRQWSSTTFSAAPGLFVQGMELIELGAVSHMCLDVSITAYEYDVSTQALAEVLRPLLHSSQLEYLHLKIGESFDQGSDLLREILPVRTTVQQAMERIHIADLVSALAKNGPFLRTIALSPASRERSVWTVDRGDEGQVLRRLDPYTAKQVVEREEK